jgi:GTP-binding protein HflX
MWTHLSRQGVGGVGLRGPGETQLEVDRREAQKRITFIKQQLDHVHTHRQLYRERRRQAPVPVVALVGYTNAGKSTLLNALTGAGVVAEDKLFATLDPTTRRVKLPSGREVLLTDTVGFINNLPTLLIAAFRATLEEINEATLLLHVLDVTHPNAAEQAATVHKTLEDLGADNKPMVTALNKVDLLDAPGHPALSELTAEIDLPIDAVPISARDGRGLDALLAKIEAAIEADEEYVPVRLRVPFARNDLVDRFHRTGRVAETTFDEEGTTLIGHLPSDAVGRFSPYVQTLPRLAHASVADGAGPTLSAAEPVPGSAA